jgi:hypothetical protein
MNSPERLRSESIVSANIGTRVPRNFASNQLPASSRRTSASVKSSSIQRFAACAPVPTVPEAIRKHLLDVGRALERVVVQADDLSVPALDKLYFSEI